MSDLGQTTKENQAFNAAADKASRTWSMFLHFSLLANCIVPVAGIVAPIVIWQMKKDDMPSIDQHGKNAVNWMITAMIYSAISVLLAFVVVGFFLLLILGICLIVFPLIAGIKANDGVVWKYPLTYEFFK